MMSTSSIASMLLILYVSTSMTSSARISNSGLSRMIMKTGVGCSKVQAKFMCGNLIRWHEATTWDVMYAKKKPLNMGEQDGVKCAAALLKKYPGQVDICKEALETLIDNKHISVEDLEDLPELKERAQQVLLAAPINVDFSDEAATDIPQCNRGEVGMTFPTVKAFGWVKQDDRTVGAETTVECGSKARDPSAKVVLVCTAREDASPIWKIKSGECLAPEITCPAANYKIKFTMRREGQAPKDTFLSFTMPNQVNPGLQNIAYPMACTEATMLANPFGRKVTGGHMNFECTTEGKWVAGKDECTWEDDTPLLPHGQNYVGNDSQDDVVSLGPGACKAVRMRFSYAHGTPSDFSVHELPSAANTKTEKRECDKTGWTGTVTYQCKDGEWDPVEEPGEPSCYKPDTCTGTSFGLNFGGSIAAKATFKLPDTAVDREKELECKDADIEPNTKLKGKVIFKCTKGANGRPEWEHVEAACQKDGPAPAKVKPAEPVAQKGCDKGPGCCKAVKMNFKYNGVEEKSTHELPETAHEGEVTKPCDLDGWAGEVIYVCENGDFKIKKTGKAACYRTDRCSSNGMQLALGSDAKLKFQLPETMLNELTPDLSCADACKETALKGTASFKCVAGSDGRPAWKQGDIKCAKV